MHCCNWTPPINHTCTLYECAAQLRVPSAHTWPFNYWAFGQKVHNIIDHNCNCINYAASCSGNVHVTSTSLNLSISVSSCDLGTFSINMIPSRWCCPRKYFDDLCSVQYNDISESRWFRQRAVHVPSKLLQILYISSCSCVEDTVSLLRGEVLEQLNLSGVMTTVISYIYSELK